MERGEIFVIFGRFLFLRRTYGRILGLLQRLGPAPRIKVLAEQETESLFPRMSLDDALSDLNSGGMHFGLSLDDETVRQIREFAVQAPCSRPGSNESFLIGDVTDGRLPDGRRVAIADVRDVEACPLVGKIAHDPFLLQVARAYLGFWPREIIQRLYWSPVSELTDKERREGYQTIDFHYDVDGYSFLNVYFYLTDVGDGGGAHAVIRGSHRRKPLSVLFATRFHSVERIHGYYGADSQVTVEGPAGLGFIEDPACFHKALAPEASPRLMLQIRFDSLERRLEETYLTGDRHEAEEFARSNGR